MLREKIEEVVTLSGGPSAPVLLLFIVFAVAPAMLIALFLWLLLKNRRNSSRDGMMMGLAVALWKNACWLLGGEVGVYFNILPALITTVTVGWPEGNGSSWREEVAVVVLNFLIWPIAGRLAFPLMEKVLEKAAGAFPRNSASARPGTSPDISRLP